MSLTVGVTFPLGRYHATPWDRHVNEGAVEWPPSPWRLVRALIAVWHDRCPELSEPDVLEVLNAVAEPPRYQLPRTFAAGTRHYYPGSAQQLPKTHATSKVLDTFRALDPKATLRIEWQADLSETARKAATTLFERMGYLGRADSICEARVLDTPPPEHAELAMHLAVPDASGDTSLLAPELPLELVAVTVQTDDMRKAGYALPRGSTAVHYHVDPPLDGVSVAPSQLVRPSFERPTVAVLSVAGRPAPSHELAVVVAERVRSALQSRYGKPNDGAVSPTFSGHLSRESDSRGEDHRRDDHRHLHLLPLAGADRRIDRIVAWAPEGFGAPEIAAMASLSTVYPPGRSLKAGDRETAEREREAIRGFPQFQVALTALGELSQVAPELFGPASVWRSATPMIPTGRPNRQDLADSERSGGVSLRFATRRLGPELGYRSYPEPSAVEFLTDSPTAAQRYRRYRVGKRLKDARPAAWLRITFDSPIDGPLALGMHSHLGLGLFVPETD